MPEVDVVSHFSYFLCYLQVSEAILDNARLMLQTENIQANAEDFKDRSEVTHTHTHTYSDSVAKRTAHLPVADMRMSNHSGRQWRRRSARSTR